MKLFDYQAEAVEKISQRPRLIVADEKGAGKSLECLAAVFRLGCKEILILCGMKVAMGTWQDELATWYNNSNIVLYGGTKSKRDKQWEEYQLLNYPCFLAAPTALAAEILSRQDTWDAIIIDEYQRIGLRHKDTKFAKTISQFTSRVFLPTSGSPVGKGPQDLWYPLHLCAPKRFPSYWKFVNEHCIVEENEFGYKNISYYPRDAKRLREVIEPYLIRRVGLKKGQKTRIAIPLEMSSQQQQMYDQLKEEMVVQGISDDDILKAAPNAISQTLYLRQLLITPRMFDEKADPGALLEALPELVEQCFDDKKPTIIFTPFRHAIDTISQYLSTVMKFEALRIVGGMKPGEPQEIIRKFQQHPDHRLILFCTIQSGASYTATRADTCFFAGAEWDADTNGQAEDRIHRVGQTSQFVKCYYFRYRYNEIDDNVFKTYVNKQTASEVMIG